MSTTIPSRKLSLRKPSESSRNGRLPAAADLEKPAAAPRNAQSPSRLPIKPPTRSTSTSTSSTRPLSTAGSITTNNASSMRPPPPRANASKPAATTSSIGLQRSTSTRRPSDAPKPTTSTSTSSTGIGLQRSSSTRRSSDAPSNRRPSDAPTTRRPSDAKPPTNTDPIKQDRSRPPLTQSRHLRSGSTSTASSTVTRGVTPPTHGYHTRNKSTSAAMLSSGGSMRPPSAEIHQQPKERVSSSIRPPSTELSQKEREPLVAHPQLSRKANFSTYQQHFSPAKSLAPKPHPATFLAPPSPSKLPSNIAISAETAKLQNELLGLHLLHKDVDVVEQEWRASCKRKMGGKFQNLINKNERLVQLEMEEMGQINAMALKSWKKQSGSGGGARLGLEEKVQLLDEVLTGVWNLGESGGKYGRLVRKFEKWMIRSQEILDARARDEGLENDEVVFLEELDAGWRDDCLNIGRKLVIWDQQLREIGMPDGDDEGREDGSSLRGKSSLARVLRNCCDLVGGMREELGTMAGIEAEAARREGEWIRSVNEDGMEDDDIGRPVAGAIWRSR